MSKRRTVKVLRLEGRTQAFVDARSEYSDLGRRLRVLFNEIANPSLREVRAALREGLLEMEVEALRDMTVAQRREEQGDEL